MTPLLDPNPGDDIGEAIFCRPTPPVLDLQHRELPDTEPPRFALVEGDLCGPGQGTAAQQQGKYFSHGSTLATPGDAFLTICSLAKTVPTNAQFPHPTHAPKLTA